jgi:hypothetical protein
MSTGRFERAKYQASYGAGTNIHPIRIQPETLAADAGGTTNDEPTGAITNPISAKVSLGQREKGLGARTVTLQWTTEPTGSGYVAGGLITIPALTEAFYDACTVGTSVTYNGGTAEVAFRTAETAK